MNILAALLASWNVSGLLLSFVLLLAFGTGSRGFSVRMVAICNLWGTCAVFAVALLESL